MRLKEDWKFVAAHAWSVRLSVLAAVLGGIEVAIQVIIAFTIPVPVPPGLFVALAALVSMAAAIARLVSQDCFR